MGQYRFRVVNLPCGLVLLAGAIALMLSGCATRSVEKPEQVTIPVDGVAAAKRLSKAIQIRTISRGPETKLEPVSNAEEDCKVGMGSKIEEAPRAEEGPKAEEAAFQELHAFLEQEFPNAHRDPNLKREDVSKHSLLYTWSGTDQSLKPILFAAHMDVVPIEKGTECQWSQDPFAGKIDEQGMIWGRGALDDKLSVLGLLEAVEFLLGKGFRPRRTVYLAFGHDEELEGNGALAIAQKLEQLHGPLGLEYVLDEGSIIGDGLVPGVEKPVAMIGVAEKGYLSIKLTAEAEGGHSSVPPQETAIGRLARAIDRLQNRPLSAEIRPPVSDMLEALAPEMSTAQGIAMQNQWLFGGIIASMLSGDPTSNAMVRTTTAPTIVRGGVKDNVLPQTASAVVNFRILPEESVSSVTSHVKQVFADGLVEVEPMMKSANEPVMPAPVDSDSYRMVAHTVQEIYPETVVVPALVVAATDSRHYKRLTGNIFRFLPVTLDDERLDGIHGNNERLETESYQRLIAFYIQLMEKSAGKS